MTEVQGQILENAKAAGIIAADVADGVRGKRDRATAAATPLLKVAVDRAGIGKPDLDRLLEKFWAQAGGRRAQLHRSVEEQLVALFLVEAGIAPEAQVAAAEKEMEERISGGDAVRLLSILVDSGAIDENAARRTVTEVQGSWRFCKYCLSSWKGSGPEGGNGAADACGVCGRPLTVAARSYEIVKLMTISEDAPVKGVESASAAAAGKGPAAKAAIPPPEAGETLAGVKLLERVDDVGRGAIWKGERVGDKAPRAIKIWRLGKDLTLDDVARFETAALSATKLEHPGILKVYEAGEDRGRHFVVSEWVEGRSVKRIVEEKGPLAYQKAVPILKSALESLEAAHKEKLLHKNVTPGNIFSLDAGGVKIGDFGVCKDYGVSLDTVRGNVIGSPDYLAPEQCQGLKSDERTDLFSLGASFYYALSGKKPFEGDSTVTLIVKRLTSDPKPLKEVAPKVPKELADILSKLMARKPEDRYASAREVIVALQRWEARVEAGIAGTDSSGGLGKILMIGGGVLFMGIVAVAVVMGLMHTSGPTEELLEQVAEARVLAGRGLVLEAAERLAPLSREEGGKGPASDALSEMSASVMAQATELSGGKDYPAALSLLKKGRAALAGSGLAAEASLAETERMLEGKSAEYEREAKDAYEQVLKKSETSSDVPAIKAWRAYRESYPHQPFEEAARIAEEKLRDRKKQQDLMDEAEKLASAGSATAARQKLSDAIAVGPLSESQEPRKRKIERLIDFTTHIAEGNRLIDAGDIDGAVKEFQRAGEGNPDHPDVKRGIARARFEGIMKKAREEKDAGNLMAAVDRMKDAEGAAAEAGIDLGPLRAERERLQKALKDAKKNEDLGKAKFAEGEAAFKRGDYRAALRAYRAAATLIGEASHVQAGIEKSLAALGPGDEEKAFQETQKKVAKATKDDEKARAWRELLDLYPEGARVGEVRDALAKLGRPVAPEDGAAVAAQKTPPLRPTDRGDFQNPADGSILVKVPAGKFKHGTSAEERKALLSTWRLEEKDAADEGPQAEVFLDEFYMDVQEVTNADYGLFLAALSADPALAARLRHESQPSDKKSYDPKYWNDEKMEMWTRPELPVVGVDWYDAWTFARWAGKRLPSEAEWEKAARGTDGRAFPWGDRPSPFTANAAEAFLGRRIADKADWVAAFVNKAPWKSTGMTASQASFPDDVSPYGCKHLGGNVWEWCEDWYHPGAYAKLGERNPVMTQMGDSKRRATRGGSWYDLQHLCRTAARQGMDPLARKFTLGFRCARSAEGAAKK